MKRYLEAVRSMEKCFAGITVEHLPRGQNEEADALAKSTACGGPHSPDIFFEVLYAPSVPIEILDIMAIDQAELCEDLKDWMKQKRRASYIAPGCSNPCFAASPLPKANPIAVGKLELKWEGPYLIKDKSSMGSFRLVTLEGEEFDHSWNAASLKLFYV
uniref:Retrotransposon protein, putative, Ty3-gypsy subclass n=1 Tax=Oryza sativa subsp. japonica TaxID=39947 RepID=Q2QTD6_ORYSJ|nr:retrotransposon protein, putative, Ty3-gypsy subclass [Oryza sativa Japonica Group]